MSNSSLNNAEWQKLFDKYDILNAIEENGFFEISATQIKEFREPRLMVKFDHTNNLPELFSKNKLAILPVTRGDYIISHFDAYHTFEPADAPIVNASLPTHIQSLNSNNIPSEAIALNCAVASGIIADFIEDSDIIPTVSGRMGSGSFSFNINDTQTETTRKINVNNSQIEIDAAYEGISCLALFEAKRTLSEDFLIRQLYYPYRVWSNRVTKKVKPVFLVYSNGIYRLYEYAFSDPNNYSSLKLVKQKNYSMEDTSISVSDIQNVIETAAIVEEPAIPFPQADNFDRIINLCELVSTRELNKADIAEQNDFVPRQAGYYAEAARYLGLLEKSDKGKNSPYHISRNGQCIMKLSFKQRQLAFCRCILSHKVFNETLSLYFRNGSMPSTSDIVERMRQSDLYRVGGDSTFERRASTIRSWLNWIVSRISE